MIAQVFLHLLDALRARSGLRTTLRGWLFGLAAHQVADDWRGRHVPVALPEDLPDGRSISRGGGRPAQARRGAPGPEAPDSGTAGGVSAAFRGGFCG